ncbi:hypothetical protein TVAG_330340 [Trichomonas vaginalis G3]|uniref:Uncharacterized protein n=1 Tax=Trichomonas vaginalis (strain ATCC PRA-98 / G3) TaxID=412133 RepID=A2GD83_TRIV3|nr:spectrin binding [Trichomonas vaginalis G3]EAX84886.1 hypothetical protein TVAG_330340 [Trichomonas vaginalis G3]KAI5494814.1 spectrin binding [Trichomonas vaginalis G3]|eukprot:XP_001297816.1 hypothetical protein [Trichomonas vaginalis G3]
MTVELQDLLLGITQDDNGSIADKIMDSIYVSYKEAKQTLIRNILFVNRIRDGKLTEFTAFLIQNIPDFKDELLFDIFKFSTSYYLTLLPDFHLVRNLLVMNILNMNDTIKIILQFIREIEDKHKQLRNIVFAIFADLIESTDKENFDYFMNVIMEETMTSDHFMNSTPNDPQSVFNQWIKQFYTKKTFQERQEFQIYMFNHGGHNNDAISALRTDNLALLQEQIASDEIDIDEVVPSSLFEQSYFLKNEPSLIQYAAYFGSVSCFKYLLMNGADLSYVDYNNQTLISYAIASGNLELIRLCEQKGLDFKNALSASAYFWRFDVFSWLIDSGKLFVTSVDSNEKTALDMTAMTNSLKIVEITFQELQTIQTIKDIIATAQDYGALDVYDSLKNKCLMIGL